MEKILPRIVQNQRYTQTSYYGTYSPPKTHLSNSRSILLHLDCLRTSFMVRQEDLHLDSDLLKSSKVYTTTKGPKGHNIKFKKNIGMKIKNNRKNAMLTEWQKWKILVYHTEDLIKGTNHRTQNDRKSTTYMFLRDSFLDCSIYPNARPVGDKPTTYTDIANLNGTVLRMLTECHTGWYWYNDSTLKIELK